MHDTLHIHLLGSPQITWQGKPVTGFVGDKARALLIYLAVTAPQGHSGHSREALAELLWADTPATKRENLKRTLSNLRRLDGVRLIEQGRRLVALDLAHCWVDVVEFEQLAKLRFVLAATSDEPSAWDDPQSRSQSASLFVTTHSMIDAGLRIGVSPGLEWRKADWQGGVAI